jgi:hypothetical protein
MGLLGALMIGAAVMPIRVVATPTPPDPYPYTYVNRIQQREREVAVEAITRWLTLQAQRQAMVVEVTRVTAKASGAPFFIRRGLPTNRHWEVTVVAHLPNGQRQTFVGSEVLISVAAIDAADQLISWASQHPQ